MYSGYIPDSTIVFKVPAIVRGLSGADIMWSASDTASLQPDLSSGGITITVLKPGTVTIQAQIGTQFSWSAPLIVTALTQAEWMAGNERFNDGVPLDDPFADAGGQPPGGFAVPSPTDPSPFEPKDGGPGPACTNCHGPTATGGVFQGIEWTPEQTAGFSDAQLTDIVVNGIIPDGGYYDSTIVPYSYWQFYHRWSDMTPAQQVGIVAYLRSLQPSPQSGKFDFGGL
jgi:hypothetical protein